MDSRITFSPGHTTVIKEEVSVPSGRVVLVTGASGLLGRAVLTEFHKAGWKAVGTAYRRARGPILRCDLLDEDAVRALLLQQKPDVIIHCAAERRPDVVERHPEAAIQLNVHATGALAKEAAAAGMVFLYISTDYVFDGRRPPYGEDDAPNPLNQYGRSKLEGERETLRHCPGALVLRVPVLYGEVEKLSESAVTTLWSGVQQEGPVPDPYTLDHCQQRFPTHTADVAAVCRNIVQRRMEDASLRGIFHFSSKEKMTKYQMADVMAKAFHLPSTHVIPLTEAPPGVSRPENCQLDCSRLQLLGLAVEPRPFSSTISSCLWPFLPDKRWRQTVFH